MLMILQVVQFSTDNVLPMDFPLLQIIMAAFGLCAMISYGVEKQKRARTSDAKEGFTFYDFTRYLRYWLLGER